MDYERASILELGAHGVLDGQPFTLTGRRVIRGHRGSVWNEWMLDGLPHTTLAESAGRLTIYREAPLVANVDTLHAGAHVPWLVVERGTATSVAQFGRITPGPASWGYADLSETPTGRRATISSGTSFIGQPTTAEQLELRIGELPPALVPAPNVAMPSGLQLWLDVHDVSLSFQATGEEALKNHPWRVIGIVARSSPTAQWEEYCVYSARVGLRWLVVVNGHWSWVESVDPGQAVASLRSETGEERASEVVRVTWATGELPWAVEIGEVVTATEHDELVEERTPDDITWSRQRPLATDDVARAFNKRALPKPR